jgi:uncharacterized integral membrane protein
MVDGDQQPLVNTSRKVNVKFVALGTLAAVLILFAVLNTHKVGVDWIFDTVSAPMIVVIGISALLGFAIGFLLRGHLANRDHR